MSEQTKLAGPVSNPEIDPFWHAAREGKLLVKHCAACGKTHFYPRSICPFCFSSDTHWREASGRGEVYSFTKIAMGSAEPYVLAYVKLEEGPAILTNIVRSDLIEIGRPVKLEFLETDSDPIPVFALAGPGEAA